MIAKPDPRLAQQKGADAFYAGKHYSENPHPEGSDERLRWLQGHNGARAAHLMRVAEKPWMDVIPKRVDQPGNLT